VAQCKLKEQKKVHTTHNFEKLFLRVITGNEAPVSFVLLFIYPVKATGRGTKISSMKRNPVPRLFWCFFLLCVFFYDIDIIFCLFLIRNKIQCVLNITKISNVTYFLLILKF